MRVYWVPVEGHVVVLAETEEEAVAQSRHCLEALGRGQLPPGIDRFVSLGGELGEGVLSGAVRDEEVAETDEGPAQTRSDSTRGLLSRSSDLHDAAAQGDGEQVRHLLDRGKEGLSPLPRSARAAELSVGPQSNRHHANTTHRRSL